MNNRLYGFTLVELLLGLVFISVGLLSVIGLMRSAISYTDKIRQDTIAINLAREGMESVYVIRNTNRLRRSGRKDQNRLCANPSLSNPDASTNCGLRMQSWSSYILQMTSWDQSYPFLTQVTGQSLDLSDGPDTNFIMSYGIHSWQNYSGWYHTPWNSGLNNEGTFYREIRGIGLYQKDTNITGWNSITTCTQGTGTYEVVTITGAVVPGQSCADPRPKEFRFCSKVEYQKQIRWTVELCGVITNYQE